MQAGVFSFFAGSNGMLNSNRHMWQWKEEAMLCEVHMHDFKSHFQQDFIAYCTKPVSAFGDGVFFNLFAQFKATTKSHENCVFLYPFSNMAIKNPLN